MDISYDDIGPEAVLNVYDPGSGMRGVIVLDSLARGPAKGGIRMALSADTDEVLGLARAMTLKNALADLPFGGGKSGIIADPKKLSADEKQELVRAFAKKLALVAPEHYVAAPDIAMAEEEMRVIADIAGRQSVTGKPEDLGGIPHELGSTGYGVYVAVREVLSLEEDSLAGKRVSVQGFGNVGSFAAKFMGEDGAVLVAASDSSATVIDEDGLDVQRLMEFKEEGGRFKEFSGARVEDPDASLYVDCDVLVPAAQRDVVTEQNHERVRASVIAEGANLPIAHAVERALESRGVRVIPDILANAGGVISSWVEHEGGSPDEIFGHIQRIICENVRELGDVFVDGGAREACVRIAKRRVADARSD